MKRLFLIIALILLLVTPAQAGKFYGFSSLTGGAAGSLDKIPTTIAENTVYASDGDMAVGVVSDYLYEYTYSATSTATTSSPTVIIPVSSVGRWLIAYPYMNPAYNAPTATTATSATSATTATSATSATTATSATSCGTANALSGAYIDWNASSGGAFIQNKPNVIPYSTLTDTDLCTYSTGLGLICTTSASTYQTALTNPLVAGTMTTGDYCTKNASSNTIDCNTSASGVLSAIGAAPTASPTFTGTVTTPAPTINTITGAVQCLHVNSSGVVSGTGEDCGSSTGAGANSLGTYLVASSVNEPANAVNLGALTTGLLKCTVSGSVCTPSTASAGTDYQAVLTNPITLYSTYTAGHLATFYGTNQIQDGGAVPTALPPNGSASGDLSGSYPSPNVAKINGTSLAGLATGILKNTTSTGVPSIASAGTDYIAPYATTTQNYIVATPNGSSGAATPRLMVSADLPATIAANTSGTAANLSGTPALPNGTTATTQTAGDSTTDLATDAFVRNELKGVATATAAGTTTLTVASNHSQLFTGTTTQTVVLPVAAALTAGWSVIINNQSTGVVTVNTSGGNTIKAMVGVPSSTYNSVLTLVCVNPSGGTGTASWQWEYRATGTFTLTATGFSGTAPTTTAYYSVVNKIVTLRIAAVTGTSNANTFTLSPLPSIIYPYLTITSYYPCYVSNNGTGIIGGASLSNGSNTISFFQGQFNLFTTSGNKGTDGDLILSYPIQ